MIPQPTICLASLVTALAIHADAFSPKIDSIETLFRWPILGDSDCLELQWREDIRDKVIFPLTYKFYNQYWKAACSAAGLRQSARLYAIRVGVGMALDGMLFY